MNYSDLVKLEELQEVAPTDAEEKAMAIVNDILQRRGLCQEWEDIDSKIQNEIFAEWVKIISHDPTKLATLCGLV